jgi:hypothetical protein
MEHGHIDIAGAAFWIFIGLAVWASTWAKSRREAEKHETLRRIIEKTGTVDETKLKELFAPAVTPEWMKPPPRRPGGGFRALRVIGTIFMFIATGLALCFAVAGSLGVMPRPQMIVALSITCIPAMLGAGFFFSSRFCELPADRGNGTVR